MIFGSKFYYDYFIINIDLKKPNTKWLKWRHKNRSLRENHCYRNVGYEETTLMQSDTQTQGLPAAEDEGEI